MIKSKKVLTKEEIVYLTNMYDSMPKKFYEKNDNLFNVFKSNLFNVLKSSVSENESKQLNIIQNKLLAFHGSSTPITNYFLTYQKDSYAIIHQDSLDSVLGTAITLIAKSDNLVGGDIIISKGFNGKQRIIPQQVGETVYYSSATFHGVTKVTEGYRKVLVTWFRILGYQKSWVL